MSDTLLMTEEAATTNEGAPASPPAESTATGAEASGQSEQQAQSTPAEATEQQAETKEPEGAPEQYEFKAPEGQQYNAVVVGKFSEVAKELNLTQAAADKLLQTMAPVIAQQQTDAVAAASVQWAKETETDKEIGGDKLTETLTAARKARDAFASPALRDLLNQSQLGNHPEVIRFFAKVGNAISEDGYVAGNKAPASGDPAKRLFPNQN